MENYEKIKTVEKELQKNDLPFENLPSDLVWMKVRNGSKISNLLAFAFKKVPNKSKSIIWSASDSAITKCVSCVEIMKNKIEDMHQVTKIDYVNVQEFWKSKDDTNTEQKVIETKVPAIFILLTLDPFEESENGMQKEIKKEVTTSPKLKSKGKRNEN